MADPKKSQDDRIAALFAEGGDLFDSSPETASAAPVEAAPPASAAKAAPATPAAPAAPSGPTPAQREAAARRRREQAEEARRRAEAAAQEAAAVELVPFGNVDTSDFIRNQALAIQKDPLVKARKEAYENQFALFNPFSDVPQADLVDFDQIPSTQEVERDQYALDVYDNAMAKADLLRSIKPDSGLMAAAPRFKTDSGRRLFENTAKVTALNKLLQAKKRYPNLNITEEDFLQGSDLADLNIKIDVLSSPSLRPYDGDLPGIRPFTDQMQRYSDSLKEGVDSLEKRMSPATAEFIFGKEDYFMGPPPKEEGTGLNKFIGELLGMEGVKNPDTRVSFLDLVSPATDK